MDAFCCHFGLRGNLHSPRLSRPSRLALQTFLQNGDEASCHEGGRRRGGSQEGHEEGDEGHEGQEGDEGQEGMSKCGSRASTLRFLPEGD